MKNFITLLLIFTFLSHNFGKVLLSENKTELNLDLKLLNDSLINITVKNTSDYLIKAYSHVETHEKQYDYFEIEALTLDHDKMIFSFYGNRDKSYPVVIELKPGESFSHTINLLHWSARNINKQTLTDAELNQLPHGVKIRAKYRNNSCENCDKSIWTGYVYSNWIDY